VQVSEEKIWKCQRRGLCGGKIIWESIGGRKGRAMRKEVVSVGWQEDEERLGSFWEWRARVFLWRYDGWCLLATLSLAEKEGIWRRWGFFGLRIEVGEGGVKLI